MCGVAIKQSSQRHIRRHTYQWVTQFSSGYAILVPGYKFRGWQLETLGYTRTIGGRRGMSYYINWWESEKCLILQRISKGRFAAFWNVWSQNKSLNKTVSKEQALYAHLDFHSNHKFVGRLSTYDVFIQITHVISLVLLLLLLLLLMLLMMLMLFV